MLEEEQVEPKAFQIQEDAEGALEEAKEGHVDQEPDMQLEDLQVDWDTEGKKILDSIKNIPMYYINILWQQEQECGLDHDHDHDHDLGPALYPELM